MTKSRSNATAPNAKGTLVVGNGTDASTTLAVASTAGYVLTVDSAQATGLKWAVPGGAAYTAWTSYTPTWSQAGGSFSLGNGTSTGFYTRAGDLVYVQLDRRNVVLRCKHKRRSNRNCCTT